MALIDETHDPARRSWVESANAAGADFPVQNLPFCVFVPHGSRAAARIGVGIGTQILDLSQAAAAGLLDGAGKAAVAGCGAPLLNPLMAEGGAVWKRLRATLSALLSTDAPAAQRQQAAAMLFSQDGVAFRLPAAIGGFSDFFASSFHATNAGRLFRPDNPLLPNYKWVPVAYHSRTSSIRLSGTPVRRPNGQTKAPDAATPTLGPCRRLDYEAEMGMFVGTGNGLGEPIPIGEAGQHLFGMSLLNDWSARDIQAWEYQPLGPFLAKSFATTIAPWVVTMEALAPYRTAAYQRPAGDPAPLPHLTDAADQSSGALDIRMSVLIETEAMRSRKQAPHVLSRMRFADMYWTPAQCVAHHTSNGCDLQTGDLLGSGTISSREPGAWGSMLELTTGGSSPLTLPDGEKRSFVENGDAIILRATAERAGYATIGFGECRAVIQPAPAIG